MLVKVSESQYMLDEYAKHNFLSLPALIAAEKHSLPCIFMYVKVTGVCNVGQGHQASIPGSVAQSVICLTADTCLTVDPGITSSIPVRSHSFVEIDHKIISTAILLTSTDALEKVWLGELTVPTWPYIAVDQESNQTN